jgi:hypothetical protein
MFGMLAALLLCAPASALNTIPVTGHVVDPSQGIPAGMSVKFELYNCGGNYPRIVGSFGIVRQNFTLTPDSSGLITGTIVPNDVIDCGGTTGTTRYNVSLLLNGVPQIPVACYAVLSTMGTFDLDTATPCASATPPPPPGGPYDATYNNLNLLGLLTGNNANFSGSISANDISAHAYHFLETPTPCGAGQYVAGFDINFSPLCLDFPNPAVVVTSFNGRQNAVIPQTGDYTCGQITGALCSLPALNYQTVKVAGTAQTQRAALNFISGGQTTVTCADNPGSNSTDCTVTTPGTSRTAVSNGTMNGWYRINADGTIEQWATGTASFTGRGQTSITWPIPFPNSCGSVQTTAQFNTPVTSTNWQGIAFYLQPGDCKTSVALQVDTRGDGSVDAPFHVVVYGMGW